MMTDTQIKPEEETLSIKCRNAKCDGISAVKMSVPGRTQHYRCVKCNHVLRIDVGGGVPL